ncbi:MAG: ribosome hibernation-promoting factor, HPF/YfiA family [Angustibacter sp.]
MEIVVTGRHIEVKERFRRHLQDKLSKVSQLAPKARRLDVVISHEPNRRQAESCDRVEITCVGKGPVVRAEAAAEDVYVALDRAHTKLLERLRRAHDRKVMRRRVRTTSLGQSSAQVASRPRDVEVLSDGASDSTVHPAGELNGTVSRAPGQLDDSPVQIREKVHQAAPMTIERALYEMELVGHDFYLFCDAGSGRPSVVYRRRGWEYGVLHLEVTQIEVPDGADSADTTAQAGAPVR